MTNFPPSPDDFDSVEPEIVDLTAERLSALVDGELGADELVDLEQLAVDSDTTIEAMSAPFVLASESVAATVDSPAPTHLRSMHISAALDAADSPEVVSLAAARATNTDQAAKVARAERLNQRLRRLSAVAAGLAIVGGVGLFALTVSGNGNEDSATASPAVTSASQARMNEDAAESGDDGAASDDGSMEAVADESEAMEAATTIAPTTAAVASPEQGASLDGAALVVPADADLRGLDLSSVDPAQLDAAMATAKSGDGAHLCAGSSDGAIVDPDLFDEAFVVEQAGQRYELVLLTTGELIVFELPDCGVL